MSEEILLFTGAVLIAFEVLGDVRHLTNFGLVAVANIFAGLFYSPSESTEERAQPKRSNTAPLRIMHQLLLIPIAILVFCLSIVFIILGTVSYFPRGLNRFLNIIYRRQLKPWQPRFLWMYQALIPNVTEDQIDEALDKMNVPFVAILGLILVSVGFALQITS